MTPRATLGLATAAVLVGTAIGGWFGWRASGAPPSVDRWVAHAREAARTHRLDPNLVLAMIAAESSGDPHAVSRADARGLMQLRLPTARERAEVLRLPLPTAEDLFDGPLNIRLGTAYLRYLLDRFDQDEVFAIAAYNAGPTAVRRWRRNASHLPSRDVIAREGYAETRAHVRRVLRYRAALASGES